MVLGEILLLTLDHVIGRDMQNPVALYENSILTIFAETLHRK